MTPSGSHASLATLSAKGFCSGKRLLTVAEMLKAAAVVMVEASLIQLVVLLVEGFGRPIDCSAKKTFS